MKRLLLTTSLIAATVAPAFADTEAGAALSGSAATNAEVNSSAADVSADANANAMGDAKATTTPLAPTSDTADEDSTTAQSSSSTDLDATLSADADATAMEPLDMNEVTAEALTGAPAYDAKDEHIGEVSEVIVNTTGGVEALIVDVGGFLGLGEKPVELPMSDLTIHEAESDIRVTTHMSEEELNGLPEYQGS
ncbi:PRC-barrel domain-containing protein [Nocardioides marinus]|nr:PRC-barrel domain-containing protein [Nocardioides marinus]